MKKFLYFSTGDGANLTAESYVCEASQIKGIFPVTTTTTGMMVHKSDENMDKLTFTHDNRTATFGHRCQDIAKAIGAAANSNPHTDGMVDVLDLDNSVTINNSLGFVTGLDIQLNSNPA
tara:strand:- start:48 stop:404 length:357 start_codon:yes stop_codon:yes gene_type:complete